MDNELASDPCRCSHTVRSSSLSHFSPSTSMMTCIIQFCYCNSIEDNLYRLPLSDIEDSLNFIYMITEERVANTSRRHIDFDRITSTSP